VAGFGPNHEVIVDFLDRIRGLGEGEALALSAAWQAQDGGRRRLAWRALRRAVAQMDLDDALEAAQSSIRSWSNRAQPLAGYGDPTGGSGLMRAQVMREAAPALVDAVSALVVGGMLDGADFEALYGPFRSIDRTRRR
jgi:hypothetical protein